MSCFKTDVAKTQAATPDPTKHVKYTQGMVLGVDDFTQEFAYLSGRDQWILRDLLGYGTIRGLAVTVDGSKPDDPQVMVRPGVAVSPRGELICVPRDQCAALSRWLADNEAKVGQALGSPVSGTLTLYVTLAYRECPTDDTPIPGEPCRSEDTLKAPSRLADDFLLDLSLEPPRQREEDALRDFVRWLRQIQVSDDFLASTALDGFRSAIRDAAAPWLSPPGGPTSPPPPPLIDYMFGAPPAWLQVRASDLCSYLREAFRLWVTELRPKWFARGSARVEPDGPEGYEDRVLLAELRIPVAAGAGSQRWMLNGPVDPPREERRPFVLHLRMLQEWLLCGRSAGTVEPALAFGSPPNMSAYSIVAAGILTAKVGGPSRQPVFNGLRVVQVENGLATFRFDDYTQPDGTFQYIVKVLAVSNLSLAVKVPAVRFLEFKPDGFVLRVTSGVAQVKKTDLEKLEFMIEVSRYGLV